VGKIARLPREVREQLNRRLLDGEKGQTLLVWLNAHEKVQRTLKTNFDGRGITKQNLSEWMHGGYREWVFQQEAIEVVRRMDIDASELDKASKKPLIDLLSRRLAAQYMVMLANGLDGKGQIDIKLLNELCRHVVALRRSDQAGDRLGVERDRLKLERDELNKVHAASPSFPTSRRAPATMRSFTRWPPAAVKPGRTTGLTNSQTQPRTRPAPPLSPTPSNLVKPSPT
jgi:hypothetical protein